MLKLREKIGSSAKKLWQLAAHGAREAYAGRSARYGMHNRLVVVMAVLFMGLIYVLAERHHYRIDLTENKEYSLAPQTVEMLESQEEMLEIIAFFGDGDETKPMVAELLAEFSFHTDKLDYRFVDADLMRSEAIKEGVTGSRYGTVILKCGEKRVDVARREIVSMRYSSGGRPSEEFSGEQALLSAMVKLRSDKATKLYFVAGHGEKILDGRELDGLSSLKESLERENYTMEEINLLTIENVPEDADILVLTGPVKNISADEWKLLEQYLEAGGAMLYMVENQEVAGQSKFMKSLGVNVLAGVVLEEAAGRSVPRDCRVILPDFAHHQITTKLLETRQLVLLPFAVPLKYDTGQNKYYGTPLLESSGDSWAELDQPVARFLAGNKFDAKREKKGPHQLALALWQQQGSPGEDAAAAQSRLVVVGDSDIASNYLFELSGNKDFILNALAWLAGEEAGMTVRPRDIRKHPVFMTGGQSRFIAYFVYMFFPLMILAAGGVVWWKRRSL